VTQIVEPGRPDVKQLTLACRVRDYLQRNNGVEGETHEDPTIGILVVQVRHIRAISGDVFPRAAAALVTPQVPYPRLYSALLTSLMRGSAASIMPR
jgi:hypothetical protein